MDTSGSHTNGSGGHGSSGATHDDDSEQDGDEDDDETQEVRLVPLGAEGDSALDAVLDHLYEALSECAALNPDPDDGSDDEDDYEFDEGADGLGRGHAGRGLVGGNGGCQWMDRSPEPSSWATPAQRAMLERYDAMLEASDSRHASTHCASTIATGPTMPKRVTTEHGGGSHHRY